MIVAGFLSSLTQRIERTDGNPRSSDHGIQMRCSTCPRRTDTGRYLVCLEGLTGNNPITRFLLFTAAGASLAMLISVLISVLIPDSGWYWIGIQ